MVREVGKFDELLSGLTGKAREERAELIEWLVERGFDSSQIREALVPVLLPANRVIGGDDSRASVPQICEDTGFDEQLLRRLHRAVGLPASDTSLPLRADAESVLRTSAFIDLGFDADEVVAMVRVLVEGLGRAAETMRKAALKAVLRPGATEVQLAEAFEDLAHRLAPVLGPMVTDLLYLQLRRTWETEAVSFAERAAGNLPGAREMTVAFADIVGFTELGESVAPEQLERIATRLGELARDVVVAPVRFVKTIGDAVMLVSSDTGLLLRVILDLISLAAQHDLPRLRAGVASGWVVSHAGDWYGSPVNLASRITQVSTPGSVVTTDTVRQQLAADDALEWSLLGGHALKGVSGEVELATVRRSDNSVRSSPQRD